MDECLRALNAGDNHHSVSRLDDKQSPVELWGCWHYCHRRKVHLPLMIVRGVREEFVGRVITPVCRVTRPVQLVIPGWDHRRLAGELNFHFASLMPTDPSHDPTSVLGLTRGI